MRLLSALTALALLKMAGWLEDAAGHLIDRRRAGAPPERMLLGGGHRPHDRRCLVLDCLAGRAMTRQERLANIVLRFLQRNCVARCGIKPDRAGRLSP